MTAAIGLIAAGGIEGLTYRALATAAGVSVGAVQHHFASLAALTDVALDQSVDVSIEASSLGREGFDVDAYVDGLPAAIAGSIDEQACQYELILASRRRPELRAHVERYYAAYVEAMSRTLRMLGLPDDAASATLVFSALDGLVLRAVVTDASAASMVEPLARLRAVLHRLAAGS